MGNRDRNNPIQIYLSDEEMIILKAKMRESEIKNMSQYIRELIVYSDVYYVEYKDIREMNTELGRIGNNINHIAHKMNQSGIAYEDDVREVKEKQEKIWQLQKSILSKLP